MGCDKKIVLIGAGSASFGMGTIADCLIVGAEELSGATIMLHDIDEENLKHIKKVVNMALKEMEEADEPVDFKIEASTKLEEALQDTSYVIMSIEHGNRVEGWMQDYYIPLSFGSRQCYGENGGVGGMFHTFRQVPPMIKIAEAMHDICPDAWLLNYSNPVPRVTWAINRHMERTRKVKFKNVGLCHGVGSGIAIVDGVLGGGVSRKCDLVSAGLNHFYFIIKLTTKEPVKLIKYGPHPKEEVPAGTDLLPKLKERVLTWAKENEKPFIGELMNIYGYLTYPGESHPGEYIVWSDAYAISVKYNFQSDARHNKQIKKNLQDTIDGKMHNYWWVRASGERAIPIIIGIENDTNQHEKAVNIRNDGCIDRFPEDCVVEVPGTVNKSGVHGMKIGRMPRGIESILLREAILQDMVVEAAITGDYNTALQALCVDSTVPNPNVGRAILDKMLEVQKDYLPQFQSKK
ncbi:MAG: hypothetical protein ACFFCS_22000 [Candidatus Hodarchaeota archaeon]